MDTLFAMKFIYSFMLPPGLFIPLLLLAALYYRRKHQLGPAGFSAAMALLLYLFSISAVGETMIRSLENRYLPPDKPSGDVIIMLGGGATMDTPDVDGLGQMTGGSANRLLASARLHRLTGAPIIVSAGQVLENTGNESRIALRQLAGLGVPESMIIVEETSRNTEENARYTKEILDARGFKKPILVTSAFHMERSVRHFSKLGMSTLPFPTDYRVNRQALYTLNDWAPSASAMGNASLAMKEYLGLIPLWLK
ncbi:YdcF family protein [Heliobacterium undosum]|uniref:YdcF family protein n=1 Tax=Heliomicrobium undosum TaxID=121734 RepID=A0A845L3X3_9FIRM|nr:YdcF family protein [Heliomicrobium undosum]MZP29725.1 YdcF family protein [Heliomicrobium undosum]